MQNWEIRVLSPPTLFVFAVVAVSMHSKKSKRNGPSGGSPARSNIVFNPEDVSGIVDGWLADMGVDQADLRPAGTVPLFKQTLGATGSRNFGLREPGSVSKSKAATVFLRQSVLVFLLLTRSARVVKG